MRTRIGDGAVIEDSVIMGADFYQVRDIQTSYTLQFSVSLYALESSQKEHT